MAEAKREGHDTARTDGPQAVVGSRQAKRRQLRPHAARCGNTILYTLMSVGWIYFAIVGWKGDGGIVRLRLWAVQRTRLLPLVPVAPTRQAMGATADEHH